MADFFHRLLAFFTKIFGDKIFSYGAILIAGGFFLFSPRMVLSGIYFYRQIFPDKNFFYLSACVWKQFKNFTTVFLDRFLMLEKGKIEYTSTGRSNLDDLVDNKKGAIILMSHMGNWEIAAHLLKKKGTEILLYMGIKNKEQLEKMQKASLVQSGIKIIAVEKDGGSPYDIIEGINFLKEGGVVAMTGDRIWKQDQKSVKVKFLNHEASIPEIPFVLSLLSGAPILIFFAFRTGKSSYSFSFSEPRYVEPADRKARKEKISETAQWYADKLEASLREHPFEWYHFDNFLGDKL